MKGSKVPRAQISTVSNLIYPDKNNKFKPEIHSKNINQIKKIQEKNEQKRLEKENYTPTEPYKMKEFKNIQSKLVSTVSGRLVKTAEEKKVNLIKKAKSKEILNKKNVQGNENIYNINNQSNLEGNDEYQIYRPNNYVVSNIIYENDGDYKKNDMDKLVLPKISNNKGKIENNSKMGIKSNSTNKLKTNNKIKEPTPTSNDLNTLNPKNNIDYIKENKKLISEDLIPSRVKKTDKKNDEFYEHNNYGKVPDYLNKFKQELEDKKELEKLKQEESKYPKGTRLLSEEERIATLDSLNLKKKKLEEELFKMPITMKTMSLQNRKSELEKQLDEVDAAVNQFSKKKVFIKSD